MVGSFMVQYWASWCQLFDATKYCDGLNGLNQLKLELVQMTTVVALGDILEQKNESP